MEKKTYKNDELCQMSYQELRKISILLRLPANIKKKHMISMIEAHQKGDGQTKTEIANKVIEERNLRRMNTQVKRSKPFILSSRVRTHQVSTDLSVSTKHEFETRYSYVAHYTKGNKGSGIIREEAEVSRRNRSLVQQSAKSTRKMTAVGKTEIMLPRNHSLTTLVQLMPQHERNFMPSCKAARVLTSETNWNASVNYESSSTSPSASEYHCPGGSQFVYGNIPFHPEYGNSFISSSSHELCRSLPYWHPRELYNSVIPGNLIIPVLPNMLNSEVASSHTTSPASMNISSGNSFSQRQCESFVRCSGNDKDLFDSENSVGILNVYGSEDINNYSGNPTRTEANAETSEPNYDYGRRFDSLRHNENLTYLVDVFAPRGVPQSTEQIYARNGMVTGARNSDLGSQISYPLIKPRSAEEMKEDVRANECHFSDVNESYQNSEYEERGIVSAKNLNRKLDNYLLGNTEQSMLISKLENENEQESNDEVPHSLRYRYQFQPSNHQEQTVLPSFMSAFNEIRSPASFVSEICIDSSRVSPCELHRSNEKGHENAISVTMSNFSQCRYISGHNHFPESICRPYGTSDSTPLFASNLGKRGEDCAYSMCRHASTETTAVHLQPIMTVGDANRNEDERTWNGPETGNTQAMQEIIANNNVGNLYHHQRSMFYSYPEDHSPYSVDGSVYPNWYEYNEGLEAKIAQNSRQDVRVVQCKKHGYHYFYALSSSQ